MPKPVIDGVGPNLKKSGTSHIWIYGENLAEHDTVEIKTPIGTTWTGTLKKPDPPTGGAGIKQKARVDLSPKAKGKTPVVDEDFADITVTVTNQASPPLTSDEKEDEAMIDGP